MKKGGEEWMMEQTGLRQIRKGRSTATHYSRGETSKREKDIRWSLDTQQKGFHCRISQLHANYLLNVPYTASSYTKVRSLPVTMIVSMELHPVENGYEPIVIMRNRE